MVGAACGNPNVLLRERQQGQDPQGESERVQVHNATASTSITVTVTVTAAVAHARRCRTTNQDLAGWHFWHCWWHITGGFMTFAIMGLIHERWGWDVEKGALYFN